MVHIGDFNGGFFGENKRGERYINTPNFPPFFTLLRLHGGII